MRLCISRSSVIENRKHKEHQAQEYKASDLTKEDESPDKKYKK